MTRTRKIAAALSAASAALFATPPTASATPTTHTTLFRESFDHLPLGPVTAGRGWTADTSNGWLTVEPGAAGHGRELRLHTEGNGRAFLVLSGLAPVGNSFWGRLRLRADHFPAAPDWAHWIIAEASGSDVPRLVRPLGGQYVPGSRANFWGVGSDLGPTGDWTAWKTTAPATAGTWTCVEFHLDATAQAGLAVVPVRPHPVVVRLPHGRRGAEHQAGRGGLLMTRHLPRRGRPGRAADPRRSACSPLTCSPRLSDVPDS